MENLLIALVSAAASLLTFFSGFGLATILTPVMVVFFPVEVAIALTAVIHFLNNIFKIFLTGKNVNWIVGLKFGVPAILGAVAGAKLLLMFSNAEPVFSYMIGDKLFHTTIIKIVIAVLLIVFALFEVIPVLSKIQFRKDKLYAGGIISGFFGGLSGHQGALRSAFLLKTGLDKEQFIATGIFIALLIDLTRLLVYSEIIFEAGIKENSEVLIIATLSSFAGAFVGNRLLKKITIDSIKKIVMVLIIILAILLGLGIL